MKSFKLFLEGKGAPTAIIAVMFKGKVLILRRGKTAPWQPLKWNFPGGVIDHGETPRQAAIRECEEEAGITPNNVKFIGNFYGHIYAYSGTTNDDAVHIRANHGIIESDAWDWITLNEIKKYDFAHPVIPLVINKVLKEPETNEKEPELKKDNWWDKLIQPKHQPTVKQNPEPAYAGETMQHRILARRYLQVADAILKFAEGIKDGTKAQYIKIANWILDEVRYIQLDIDEKNPNHQLWYSVNQLPIPGIQSLAAPIVNFWKRY